MPITITIQDENVEGVRRQFADLLGRTGTAPTAVAPTDVPAPAAEPEPEPVAEPPAEVDEDKRLMGAPGEGRQRRNSAEKSDDDALMEKAQAAGWSEEKVNASIAEQGRAATAASLKPTEERPNISANPENREEPEPANDMLADDGASAPAPTLDEVRPHLASVILDKGEAKAGEILGEFVPDGEPMKISSVPKEKRAALIAACEKAVA